MKKRITQMRNKPNDVIFTPLPVVLKMIEMCNITPDMNVLDCSAGTNKIFYNNLPSCNKYYCEILEDKDFFLETKHYDLIIGNPPFSIWTKWIKHTLTICDKFCYIMGNMNFSNSRLNLINDANFGLTKFHIVNIDWWFGSSFCLLFEKNKPSIITADNNIVLCECGKKCGRGKKSGSANLCGLILN